jgi:rhodanese-related sulfurtransferase
MKDISFQKFKSLIKNDPKAIVLDVRTSEEFSCGHLPGAINVNFFEDFLKKADALDKLKNYYVYCAAGSRSESACHILDDKVQGNVYNLYEGIDKWPYEIE